MGMGEEVRAWRRRRSGRGEGKEWGAKEMGGGVAGRGRGEPAAWTASTAPTTAVIY